MIQRIQNYYNKIAQLKQAGKTNNETSIRQAFLDLVESYAKDYNLIIVPELRQDKYNIPDAGLQSQIGLNYGYIENKDIKDNIETEIEFKIKKGYKTENIIFENSKWFVLYQANQRICKLYIGESDLIDQQCDSQDFERYIKMFVEYEPQFVKDYREAIEKFKENVPQMSDVLHKLIAKQMSNQVFNDKIDTFLKDCQSAIKNTQLNHGDINDMIVQHILTKDIFSAVLGNDILLKYNAIAKSIESITATFFTRELEEQLKKQVRIYYEEIKRKIQSIHQYREKQDFLKTFYEEFYKAYNPAKADKQGIEYTPIEVVRFMIKMTDLLLLKHFDTNLQEKGVEVLDPCTGTGIFITELLYEIQHSKDFRHKFENEIYCNEIDIMPYYIANLNIEYVAHEIFKEYLEFKNLVFVDTLNNIYSLNNYGIEKEQFGLFSESNKDAFNENNQKIARQNQSKLKVIIGNPPYNSNQQNENDNNKNYSYPHIDKRIKETYIKKSTAQKTKQFDLYKRFIRWASDRMDTGIVAFITNNSYLDAKQDDGFRACVTEEFDYAYFVDLQGDVRANPKISGTKHNVFGIQTGVGIMFLVKNGDNPSKCNIKYTSVDDYDTKDKKLDFLNKLRGEIDNINEKSYNQLIGKFTTIKPNSKNQWLGLVENDWETLVPLISKDVKNSKNADAIFKLYSLGVATNRDKWVYDVNSKNLEKKVKKFIQIYDEELKNKSAEINKLNKRDKSQVKTDSEENQGVDSDYRNFEYDLTDKIKWTDLVKEDLLKKKAFEFDQKYIRQSVYRPFVKKYIYFSEDHLIHRKYQLPKIFPNDIIENRVICIDMRSIHGTIILNHIPDLHTNGDSLAIPLNIYQGGTTKMPNLTEYGKKVFEEKYKTTITDSQIFYYCYAVLNRTEYKIKYKENLKVDLPRIPLLNNFFELSELGKKLADLHINYETATKYKLELFEIPQKIHNQELIERDFKPNIALKVDKTNGEVKLDDKHLLRGIPVAAFDYKIGNRSPIEWVCSDNCFSPLKYDKTANEQLLAEIDDYNWQEIKDNLIDLIPRLVTVSLKTQEIIGEIDSLD